MATSHYGDDLYGDCGYDARDEAYEDAKADARAESGGRRSRYRCGGYASYHGHCGATDCDTCYPGGGSDEDREPEEETVSKSRVVVSRKARYVGEDREIRPGDRVRVTKGFTYVVNGPRTGYFTRYLRFEKGPAWPVVPFTGVPF